jgi:hypothetical protein
MNRFTNQTFKIPKWSNPLGILVLFTILLSTHFAQAQSTCGNPVALTTSNFPGTTISVSTYEGVCLLCGPENTANVINGNTEDYAEMRFGASLGAKNIIGVKAPVVFPAGSFAGMAYNPQVGTFTLVGLDILGNVVVSTYLNGQQQESQTSSNLINGDILDFFGGKNTIGFTTSLPFDEIRITQTATIGLLSNSGVYHAVVKTGCFDYQGCPTNATIESGTFTANGTPGQTGSIAIPITNTAAGPVNVSVSGGGFSTVTNPQRIVLAPAQSFATIPVIYNGSGVAGVHATQVNIVTSDGVKNCTVNIPVSATVTPSPTVSSSPNPPVVGQPATLTASGCTGGTITWFNNGVQIGTGSPYTVASVPGGASYTSTCTINGVVSQPSTPITTPAAPGAPTISSNPNPPVAGQSATLTASGCAGTTTWYNNGSQAGTGSPLNVANVPANSSYTATCTVNGVASQPSTAINSTTPTVTNPPTISPSPNPLVVGQPAVLTAQGCAGTVTWLVNGSPAGVQGNQYSVGSVTSGAVYTATCTVNGVVSQPSQPITAPSQVNPPTTSSNPNPLVVGQPAVLTAQGCAGTVTWLVNGNPAGVQGNTYNVGSVTSGAIYTATCTVNGVASQPSQPITAPTAVNAPTITSNPSPLVVGNAAQLNANGCAGTVSWYNNGTFVGSGTPYTVTNVPANASYTATCSVNGVTSPASQPITTGTGTVNPPSISSSPNPPVAGQSVTLSANGCAGTVTWLNNGSQVGTGTPFTTTAVAGANYTATCTVNGTVSSPSTPITVSTPTPADLAIAFTTNPGGLFTQGQSKQFTITVRNLSGSVASNSTTLSITPVISGFTVSGGGSQNVGVLQPNGTQQFTVTLTATGKGSIGALNASLPSSADNNVTNNSAAVGVSSSR